MNYKVILCLACVLFVFSCKKAHQSQPDPTPAQSPKPYHVKFNVSGFDQTQVSIDGTTLKTNELKTSAVDPIPVNRLSLEITNSLGQQEMVYMKSVLKGSSDFGFFDAQLFQGSYTAYFYGGDTDMYFRAQYGDFSYPNYWKDTFYTTFSFGVDASGNITPSQVKNVQLSRLTGQLELNVEDAIPSNVTSIRLGFTDHDGTLGSQNKPILFSKPVLATDIGKTNFTVDVFTLNVYKVPFSVTIDYFTTASSTTPAATKIVSNVTCESNKRTILSGKLFTPNASTFNVALDQNWNSTNTVKY